MSFRRAIDSFATEFRDPDLTTLELRDNSGGNPLENPQVSLASPIAWQWLSQSLPTAAAEIINDRSAMQINTVYGCVRKIAEAAGSLPLDLFKELPNNARLKAKDNPLYRILRYVPNGRMHAFVFWKAMFTAMASTGNAYSEIDWAKNKSVRGLYPLHPDVTSPKLDHETGEIIYETSDGVTSPGSQRYIKPENILHFQLNSLDGLKAMSPIQQARESLGLAAALTKFGARFFGNGAHPSGLLTPKTETTGTGPKPKDEKSASEARKSFESAVGGINQGRIVALNTSWEFTPITISNEDSQFLESRGYTRADIAASIFNMDPHFVGDTTRMSNANHEQQQLQFLTSTLRPYLVEVESEIMRKILIPTHMDNYDVRWDVTEFQRGDFESTQQGFATGRQWGWYTGNDVRRDLGENPGGPELDVYIIPVNMQNAQRLLDTESIQDQPIDNDSPFPTADERNAVRQFRISYLNLFRDAVGRACNRDKRDLQTMASIFQPVLESIAELSVENARRSVKPLEEWSPDAAAAVQEHLSKMTGRAQTWEQSRSDEIASGELTRAVRALTFTFFREAGEHKANETLKETPDANSN